MSIDWSTAPADAEFYNRMEGRFYRRFRGNIQYFEPATNEWDESRYTHLSQEEFVARPIDWPEETRIDIIGQQGNTGEHYTKSATGYLSQGMQILTERGKQYGSNGRECSFPQVAEAFNAITGNELSGSDVCMILAILKLVRQSAQPDRLHEDSLVDGVNYMALYAEMVGKELSK